MKPPRFTYYDPSTVSEAVDLLHELGSDAKILSGGQSLIPMLNFRLARPVNLIDINGIGDLAGIHLADETLVIGALTRHAEVERSELVRRHNPLLAEAVKHIGHSQIRNRGTVGGSVAHADPTAELTTILAVLDGEVAVTSKRGVRRVTAADFFVSYFTTALESDELLTEVRFPALPHGTGWSFQEVARRHGDFAIVSVAATMRLDEGGRCKAMALAVSGVDAVPYRVPDLEQEISGQQPGEALFKRVGSLVEGQVSPEGDIHGSSEYRRHLVGVLVERALSEAAGRARGEGV